MEQTEAGRIAEKWFPPIKQNVMGIVITTTENDANQVQCEQAIQEFARSVAAKIIRQGAGCTRRTQANMNWAADLLLREAGIEGE